MIMQNFAKAAKDFSGRFSAEASIPTHLTADEKLLLYTLSKNIGGQFYAEICSYIGASSCFIAAGIKDSGKSGRLFCIDTWQNDAMTEGKRDTLSEFNINTSVYNEFITPLQNNSVTAAKGFKHKLDFLFIDGDHSIEGVRADMDAWNCLLKEDSILIFHDVSWSGAGDFVKSELGDEFITVDMLPNMWVGRKRKNPTLGRSAENDILFFGDESLLNSYHAEILEAFLKNRFAGAVCLRTKAEAENFYENFLENLVCTGSREEGLAFIAIPSLTYMRLNPQGTFTSLLEAVKQSGMSILELNAKENVKLTALTSDTSVQELINDCISHLQDKSNNFEGSPAFNALLHYTIKADELKKELANYAAFVESYVIMKMKEIAKAESGYSLIGAGQHSRWLISIIASEKLPMPICIIDDNPQAKEMNGIRIINSENLSGEKAGTVIISSDNPELRKILSERASKISSAQLVDLYAGMPPGPYPKKRRV